MLSYSEFFEKVKSEINGFLTDEMKDYQVEFRKAVKINHEIDSMNFKSAKGGNDVSPCLYVNDLYERYLGSGDFEITVRNAVETLKEFEKNKPGVPDLSLVALKDKIVFQLVNTAQNEQLLETVPHREFEDLSVVYRGVVEVKGSDVGSFLISNSIAESMGISEEQLYAYAKENVMRMNPPVVKDMADVLRELLGNKNMDDEMITMMFEDMPAESRMYVVSNTSGFMGATAMLYQAPFDYIAEKVDSDLYVLPSSVHEVIAISSRTFDDPEHAAEMVQEINSTQVALSDRLSNQVYFYDRSARTMTLATDSPNKMLDGSDRDVEINSRSSR